MLHPAAREGDGHEWGAISSQAPDCGFLKKNLVALLLPTTAVSPRALSSVGQSPLRAGSIITTMRGVGWAAVHSAVNRHGAAATMHDALTRLELQRGLEEFAGVAHGTTW